MKVNPTTRQALLVCAKRPASGATKTRLSPPLTLEEAAELYACFLQDTLDIVRHVQGERQDFSPFVCYYPADDGRYFALIAPDFDLLPQRGAALGDRMARMTEDVFAMGYERLIIIGADIPSLPSAALHHAFAALERGVHTVLGPAEDGGYYLIGLAQPSLCLFTDVGMSTPHVLAQTVGLAQAAGLSVEFVQTWYDVDTEIELRRLARDLAVAPPHVAVATRRFLASRSDLLGPGWAATRSLSPST